MGYISEAMRLIRDAKARKRNEQRGQQELQQRETEAMEEIARCLRSQSSGGK